MCITCGCGGKEATIEDLDQTVTHSQKKDKDKSPKPSVKTEKNIVKQQKNFK